MKLERNKFVYGVCRNLFGLHLNFKYSLSFGGSGIPEEGSAFVLVNHNKGDDIGIEDRGLAKLFHRNGNWGVRGTLSYQWLHRKNGGVPLARSQDYTLSDGSINIAGMNKVNTPAVKYIRDLLKNHGEVFVLHPEGTRGKSEDFMVVGDMDMSLINYVNKLGRKVDGGIPLVYAGINYGIEGNRPKVHIEFERGDWNVSDLKDTTRRRLAYLSGSKLADIVDSQ